MCTSIAMKTKAFYFGRNMDIDYSFNEKIVITPRRYPFRFRHCKELSSHCAVIGMAAVIDNYPLYAEAANEKGLCMAGLNFPGNAVYSSESLPDKFNVAVFELIPWILCRCSCVRDAKELLAKTNIIGEAFSADVAPAQLHWHIADKTCSVVLELTKDGMKIYDNPVGVMTNNPPFDFHLQNLAQYAVLDVKLPSGTLSRAAEPFCRGLSSHGLPGDYSSPSRFVKTAYLLANSVCAQGENESVSRFFHLLDSAAVISGAVESVAGRPYYTTYSCCINADDGIYYYKTYTNSRINAVGMKSEKLDTDSLISYTVDKQQSIHVQNEANDL